MSVGPTTEIAEKGISALRFTVLGSIELTGPNTPELRAALVQPKRLALLAYLALASPRGFHRRDTLVSLFWPESDEQHARHALRQALHTLRRAMGSEVIISRGDNDLAVDHDSLWCDACAFQDALDTGDLERAISLYTGDFLPGFFVSNAAPELEQWLEAERGRLKGLASTAAWSLASFAERRGDSTAASRWARKGLAFSPDDEGSLRRLIALLDRLGDRAGALRAHDDFSRWLAAEFDAEPSAETKLLIDIVRSRQVAHQAQTPSQAAEPDGRVVLSFPSDPSAVKRAAFFEQEPLNVHLRPRRIILTAIGILAAAMIAAFGYSKARNSGADVAASAPVVAVGNITERGISPSDTLGEAGTLGDLLATDLARVAGLHVISHSRLYEILGQIGNVDTRPGAISNAARRAGATELLEGVLYRRPGIPTMFRLDLRRIELKTGVVNRAWSAEGTDLFSLADSVTSHFAGALRLAPPARALAGVTSTSLAARRLYEQGLRRYYQGDMQAASRYFLASLDQDSTFGLAASFVATSATVNDQRRVRRLLARAARNASNAPERERLLIRYAWARDSNDPSAPAFADSLALRYPSEPNGEYLLGSALSWSGDFAGAIKHLRLALSRDSLGFSRAAPASLCPACDAMHFLVYLFINSDSTEAAEVAAREWIRMQPGSAAPRVALAEVLAREGRRAEALAQARSAARTTPGAVRDSWLDVRIALAAGDFNEAHRLLGIRSQNADRESRNNVLWWTIIALRYEGRLGAANAALARFCSQSRSEVAGGASSLECSLATGPVLFEMGHYRQAGRLYESVASAKEYQLSDATINAAGITARHRSWMLTHAASAYAAAGDTATLASLADSVERWGRLSGYGRDQRLYLHLRGLLSQARGRHNEAIAFFRRAIYSLSEGYTRTNLELARELIAVGKAPEAIGILRSALRGPIDGSNLYVTQTEIHEMLAKAFERAGARDSAAAHYRHVALAWHDSDIPFRARAAAALGKSSPVVNSRTGVSSINRKMTSPLQRPRMFSITR